MKQTLTERRMRKTSHMADAIPRLATFAAARRGQTEMTLEDPRLINQTVPASSEQPPFVPGPVSFLAGRLGGVSGESSVGELSDTEFSVVPSAFAVSSCRSLSPSCGHSAPGAATLCGLLAIFQGGRLGLHLAGLGGVLARFGEQPLGGQARRGRPHPVPQAFHGALCPHRFQFCSCRLLCQVRYFPSKPVYPFFLRRELG